MPPPMSLEGAPQRIELSHGTLTVAVTRTDYSLQELCDFASRRNPRRPFLFVSRVLGRHLPTRPRVMAQTYTALAAKLDAALPSPVVMLGMAETAVGLGQGVFEAWLAATQRTDALYLPSTRYRLSHPILLTFEERHSHAIDHILYQPRDATLLSSARTLVLIDDEASTGATFRALAEACRAACPALETIVVVTLTDWMGEAGRERLRTSFPIPVRFVSLLEGSYHFTPSDTPPPTLPNVVGTGTLKDHLLGDGGARRGRRRAQSLPPALRGQTARAGERILVLGSGEFVHLPFLLARHLEAQGAEVFFQATTRSPILPGQAITRVLEFLDPCEDAIPNYLYGVSPTAYDRIVVCYETPPHTAQRPLLEALNAQALHFPASEETA